MLKASAAPTNRDLRQTVGALQLKEILPIAFARLPFGNRSVIAFVKITFHLLGKGAAGPIRNIFMATAINKRS
jgi:hypothetical protein